MVAATGDGQNRNRRVNLFTALSSSLQRADSLTGDKTMHHDLLHIQGKPFVLVPLHDYRMLSSNTTDESDDLPETILDALHTGQDSPVKILRKHRDMTQDDLAVASGISRPYLTEIETRKKTGSLRAIQALAKALNVAPALLMPKTI